MGNHSAGGGSLVETANENGRSIEQDSRVCGIALWGVLRREGRMCDESDVL